jgi:16S rRNA processing protein RimM
MESPSRWIVLASILRPQGRKGEVLADLFTDFPERFNQHSRVWLAAPGFAEHTMSAAASNPAAPAEPAEVASHWLPVGRNAGRIVLHFAGIDSIEQAQKLAGKEVIVPLTQRLPLEEGAAYVSDLIGCTVYDRDLALGVVQSVQFPSSPDGSRRIEDAAPLLEVIPPGGGEILIPFASAFLLKLDLAGKTIRMELPEGLADINLQSRADAGPDPAKG